MNYQEYLDYYKRLNSDEANYCQENASYQNRFSTDFNDGENNDESDHNIYILPEQLGLIAVNYNKNMFQYCRITELIKEIDSIRNEYNSKRIRLRKEFQNKLDEKLEDLKETLSFIY